MGFRVELIKIVENFAILINQNLILFIVFNNEINNQPTFNLNIAHPMADDYMRMADRAIKLIPQQDNERKTASTFVAISSLAFAIEVYLKSLLFSTDESTYGGHDLSKLWKKLKPELREWMSGNFDNNFDSENEKWTLNVTWSPHLKKKGGVIIGKPFKVKFPDFTAYGIIKGHRDAFRVGGYGYERPVGRNLKSIMFNLNGLQILSWIVRGMARYTAEEVEKAKKNEVEGKIGDRIEVTLDFPKKLKNSLFDLLCRLLLIWGLMKYC